MLNIQSENFDDAAASRSVGKARPGQRMLARLQLAAIGIVILFAVVAMIGWGLFLLWLGYQCVMSIVGLF